MIPLPGVWQRVALHEVPATPWRNGGGITHELVAQPPGLWRWRVSVARIDRDGPFSHFEGVQRHFAVVRGAGVRLHLGGQSHWMRAQGPALSFSGADRCRAELIDGPTLDFNLMGRQVQAQLVRCQKEQALGDWQGAQVAGVYACSDGWLRHDSGARCRVQTDELLWTEELAAGGWSVDGADLLVFHLNRELG